MHQSLLAHDEEEDELLWNELKDDHHHAPHVADGARHPAGRHHASRGRDASVPLPSLRAHVHLPAISSLFHSVVDSAQGSLAGRNRDGVTETHRQQQQQSQSEEPSMWRSHAPDALGRVRSLDAFLISLYNYFYHKGFWSIAVVELVALFTGLFSVVLSSFLMGCVQWQRIIECNHRRDPAHPCDPDLEEFITCRVDNHSSISTVLTSFYFIMFLGYWLFRALALVGTLRDAHGMAAFYHERYALAPCCSRSGLHVTDWLLLCASAVCTSTSASCRLSSGTKW